jgi:hypothetical protein
VLQILGPGYDYIYLPSVQTCDGILVAWKATSWSVSSPSMGIYSISAKIRHVDGSPNWWLTSVYGPTADVDKPMFLEELHELQRSRPSSWLLNGDFNMIYRAEDKSNNWLDRRRMGQFCRFLNEAVLKEIHLNGHLCTWSNKRVHPTLQRINQVCFQ